MDGPDHPYREIHSDFRDWFIFVKNDCRLKIFVPNCNLFFLTIIKTKYVLVSPSYLCSCRWAMNYPRLRLTTKITFLSLLLDTEKHYTASQQKTILVCLFGWASSKRVAFSDWISKNLVRNQGWFVTLGEQGPPVIPGVWVQPEGWLDSFSRDWKTVLTPTELLGCFFKSRASAGDSNTKRYRMKNKTVVILHGNLLSEPIQLPMIVW